MRTLAFAAFLLPAAAMATVHTNGIVNGATDWCAGASYGDGVVPSAGDVVVVSNGFVATVADAASMAKVSSLSFVLLDGTGKVVFDVPEGEVWTNSAAVTGSSSTRNGCMYKDGLGELYLNSFDRRLVSNYLYDYAASNIIVAAGTLRFRQKSGNRVYMYPNVRVDAGATLVLNTNGGSPTTGATYIEFTTLTGAGEVTSPTENYLEFRILGTCTFDGKFTGSVSYHGNGRVMFTGEESSSSLTPWVYGGDGSLLSAGRVTGIAKIGNAGGLSSLGTADSLCIGEKGGGYLYLGEGETTNKKLEINTQGNADACPAFFDAGAKGGITFTGAWGFRNSAPSYAWIEPIVIMGSNTTECVMSNSVCGYTGYPDNGFWTAGGTNYALHIVKRGSGAWRFAKNGNQFAGGFSIDEGTLRYDTIDETNLVSSLGKGGVFYDDAQTREPWKHKVDYCFRLGNENLSGLDKTEGTLEYTGTQGASAGTRTFALKGHGRLLNNTATRVRYTGFTSISSGNHVLTLDGTGLNTNEVFNVSDGTGTVSIVKAGTGTWGIGGDTTFSGSLDVRGGTLLVYSAPTNYTWFLWTIRALGKAQQIIHVGKFGLYDADGRRLNADLAYNAADHSSLDPGQVAYRSHGEYYVYGANYYPDSLFKTAHNNDTTWYTAPKDGYARTPTLSTPQYWFYVVMRLTNETAVVDSYDYFLRYRRYSEGSGTTGNTNPKNYTLYGSTDGLNWDALHDVQDNTSDDPALNGGMPLPTNKSYYWVSTSNNYVNADATCHKGHPIRGCMQRSRPKPLCNVSSVSVSGGGVLKCAAAEKIELSSVTVDCTAEAGTIDGFSFSDSGTLDVVNYTRPQSGDVVLPVRFENVDGLSDVAQWGLKINGKASRYGIQVKNGNVHVVSPGMILLVK